MPLDILELQRNVADGAELLDNARGVGDWPELVDIDRLDMSDPANCVLGQIYAGAVRDESGYRVGLDTLGLDIWADEDEAYGFILSLSNPGVEGGMKARWEILRQLWIFQIVIRSAE